MTARLGEGSVVAGWTITSLLPGDSGAPHFTATSGTGDRGVVGWYPFAGERRTLHEALAARARGCEGLEHPRLQPVTTEVRPDGVAVVVSDLERFGSDPLSAEEALGVVRVVVEALTVLHGRGEPHGDVGAWSVVKLGREVKLLTPDARPAPVELAPLQVPQDPVYAAPEVLDGQGQTPASDVFSVGLLLFRLATGKAPAAPIDPVEAFAARARNPVPDLAAARPDLAAAVHSLYARLTAEPDLRPQDAAAVLKDLDRLAKGPLPAPERSPTPIKKEGVGCALLALTLLLLAAAGAYFYAVEVLGTPDPTTDYALDAEEGD